MSLNERSEVGLRSNLRDVVHLESTGAHAHKTRITGESLILCEILNSNCYRYATCCSKGSSFCWAHRCTGAVHAQRVSERHPLPIISEVGGRPKHNLNTPSHGHTTRHHTTPYTNLTNQTPSRPNDYSSTIPHESIAVDIQSSSNPMNLALPTTPCPLVRIYLPLNRA